MNVIVCGNVVPGTDLSGTPTRYSGSEREPDDCSVPEKLNKVRLCETSMVVFITHPVGQNRKRQFTF